MQGGGLDCGDNDGGTGHVAFHVAHVGGRFQGNAAGIESDAFTDQTEVEFFGVFSAFPLQHGHPRGIDRTLGNRQQHVHAEVMQLGFVENGDVDAEIIQTFDVGGVNFRREVVGRFVAEVAGIADGVGQSAVGGKFLIVDLRFAQKFDFFQFGVAVSRLFGEIFVKTVAAEFYSEGYAGLCFDGLKEAVAKGDDVVFVDTAGRLQNKSGLMDELRKIVRVMQKVVPDAPHETLLTLDATTGQNALSQVEVFKQCVPVSGLVVTKLDGTAKGGVVAAIAGENPTPIYYVGVGEGIDDLDEFRAADYARNLVGL